ncbi:cancer-associated gene 1 protein [Trichosurus vulpecula]|uniref:cancer-associated gene 1 protein n=1 Tax=Trichosurus vulpecula TaxID=9337 RepID=UPI00186ADAC6|nr:cancer-associated gene 1 protein [Trichosurus vulpecula]
MAEAGRARPTGLDGGETGGCSCSGFRGSSSHSSRAPHPENTPRPTWSPAHPTLSRRPRPPHVEQNGWNSRSTVSRKGQTVKPRNNATALGQVLADGKRHNNGTFVLPGSQPPSFPKAICGSKSSLVSLPPHGRPCGRNEALDPGRRPRNAQWSPKDEINKVHREKDPTYTVYKDDYATLDNLKHGNSLEDHLQTVLISPNNTKTITQGGFESVCKFHRTEALNNESEPLQDDGEQLSSTRQPALQSQCCDSASHSSVKKEKNPEQNDVLTFFIKKDVYTEETLVNSPKSPLLKVYDEFAVPLPITEESLFDSIIKDTSINLKKTLSFLYEKNVCTEVGESLLKEGFDQTAIHKAKIDAEKYVEHTKNSGDNSTLQLPFPLDKTKDFVQDLMQSNRCDQKNRMSNIIRHQLDGENHSNRLQVRNIFVNPRESQNAREAPEKSNICPKEVRAESPNRHENFLIYFTDTSTWSEASVEDFSPQDTKHGFESLQPLEEEHIDLNDVINTLKQDNHKQQSKITELEYSNFHLENNVKELQMKISKQQLFVDIINKLKKNVEELIEDKYRVILEKNDIENSLKNLQKVSNEIQKQLEESVFEKNTLILELKKMKKDYVVLQEKHKNELELKNKSINYCLEMDKTLNKKEEIGRLQSLRGELDKATSTRELLQIEFQRHEEIKMQERQELKCSLSKLVAQVKVLQSSSENERAKNAMLQQQINKVKNENAKLQQQIARSEEQNYNWKLETAQWKQQLEEIMESDFAKKEVLKKKERELEWKIHMLGRFLQDMKIMHSNVFLNCPPFEEESLNSPYMKKTSQFVSKMHDLMALMMGLLTCEDTDSPNIEHLQDSENVYKKMKCFNFKKKSLEKELLKHKERISTFRQLIANEKAFQEKFFEDRDTDSEEFENYTNVPDLLSTKLDQYHNLNGELNSLISKLGNLLESKEDQCNKLIEENDEYQKHLGNLTNKDQGSPREQGWPDEPPAQVTSYEEIIECADQRLEMSHFQIAHLEKRNRQLEDFIKKPNVQISNLRTKGLEKQPKSMTAVYNILEAKRKDLKSPKLKTKYCQSYSHPMNRLFP